MGIMDRLREREDWNWRKKHAMSGDLRGHAHGRRTPPEEFEWAEEKRSLLAVANDMTPRQREAVILYFFEEMTKTAIGERLGITRQSVSEYIEYALKKVEKSLPNIPAKTPIFFPMGEGYFYRDLMRQRFRKVKRNKRSLMPYEIFDRNGKIAEYIGCVFPGIDVKWPKQSDR